MTREQILIGVITKAVAGGFDLRKWPSPNDNYWPKYLSGEALIAHVAQTVDDMRLEHLIFNHYFAKGLWREFHQQNIYAMGYCMHCDAKYIGDGDYETEGCWTNNLQEMVIYKDRIDYLRAYV